jgi:hypothetical protein
LEALYCLASLPSAVRMPERIRACRVSSSVRLLARVMMKPNSLASSGLRPSFAVSAVLSDVPDGEDAAGIADTELDVRFFTDPAPVADSVSVIVWHIGGFGRIERPPSVLGFPEEVIEHCTVELAMRPDVDGLLETQVFESLAHLPEVFLEDFHIAGIEEVEAIAQTDHGTDDGGIRVLLMDSGPPPGLLESVFPEVHALAEPFVILVAIREGLSRNQAFCRISVRTMISDHRPVVIGEVEGSRGHEPKLPLGWRTRSVACTSSIT